MRSSALVLAGLVAVAVSSAETLERIMAVVDERPIFLSDVRAVEAMDGVAAKDALERLIDETLLAREAERLPPPATPAEGAAAAPPLPSSTAVQRALTRRAAIRRYAAFRFRPQVRVDEGDVRKAYAEQWSGRAEAPPLERASADIRERLVAAQVDARVTGWVRDLRTAARIRYNAPD